MTQEEIKNLKKKLPRGWSTTLANMANVSEITVWKVFKGRSTNSAVLDAAVRLIELEQQREAKIKKILEA